MDTLLHPEPDRPHAFNSFLNSSTCLPRVIPCRRAWYCGPGGAHSGVSRVAMKIGLQSTPGSAMTKQIQLLAESGLWNPEVLDPE